MLKKSQKGFAAVETILILVIIALIAFVAWYAFNTKGNTDDTLGTAANTQTEPSKNQEGQPHQSATNKSQSQIVTTKTDAKLGQYLADGNGKALYTYGADTSGVSNCTGACLADWPVYEAPSSSADLPANVTIIRRSDGGTQYAYKGLPLYYYTGDTAGQVTGDGVNDFHIAKP